MYPDYMNNSLKRVEETRERRYKLAKELGKEVFAGQSGKEREIVLSAYHPDNIRRRKRCVQILSQSK